MKSFTNYTHEPDDSLTIKDVIKEIYFGDGKGFGPLFTASTEKDGRKRLFLLLPRAFKELFYATLLPIRAIVLKHKLVSDGVDYEIDYNIQLNMVFDKFLEQNIKFGIFDDGKSVGMFVHDNAAIDEMQEMFKKMTFLHNPEQLKIEKFNPKNN